MGDFRHSPGPVPGYRGWHQKWQVSRYKDQGGPEEALESSLFLGQYKDLRIRVVPSGRWGQIWVKGELQGVQLVKGLSLSFCLNGSLRFRVKGVTFLNNFHISCTVSYSFNDPKWPFLPRGIQITYKYNIPYSGSDWQGSTSVPVKTPASDRRPHFGIDAKKWHIQSQCVLYWRPWGTGKTFLYKCLIALCKLHDFAVISVVWTGIAAMLLPEGRTVHSRFKLPLNLHEHSISGLKVNSKEANGIKNARIIIWDEAPMAIKHVFPDVCRQAIKG